MSGNVLRLWPRLPKGPERFYAQMGVTVEQISVMQVQGLLGQGFEGDVYRQAAADVLGIPLAQVTGAQRFRVKRACFAHYRSGDTMLNTGVYGQSEG